MSRKKPSIRSLKNKAWSLCSQLVRRREADEGGFVYCFTCGKPIHWKYEAQAGHAIGGRRNAVLLDDSIIRPQCYPCNDKRIGNGMPHIFIPKLIRENGIEWWEAKAQNARKPQHMTRSDWEDSIRGFQERLALLERGSIHCTSSQSPGSSENQDQLAEVEGQ